MRWIWIDKFIEFQSGRHAVALKNVTLAEEHLHDHFPGFWRHYSPIFKLIPFHLFSRRTFFIK